MRYAVGQHAGAAAWRTELALELIYRVRRRPTRYGMASGGSNIGAHYRNPMAPIHGRSLIVSHGRVDLRWAKLYDILFSIRSGGASSRRRQTVLYYTHADSSGWNDATMFLAGMPPQRRHLGMVVVGRRSAGICRRLGKNAEADYWFEFSDRMLKDMIDYLWDGEKFVVKHDITGEIPPSHSIGLFQVVMLGKRLPQHITDKLVAALADKSRFNAPQGFTLEAMDSPYYDVRGKAMCLGRIFGMANFYAIYGLYQSGEIDFAQKGRSGRKRPSVRSADDNAEPSQT